MSVIAILLVAAAYATGYVFHAKDHGPIRNLWFAWHRTLGVAILAAAVLALRSSRGTDRAFVLVAWSLLAGVFLSGWLAVSAWADPTGSGTLIGGVPLPLLPGVSYDLGNSGEQFHKLFAMLLVWLSVAYAAMLVWRRLRRRRKAARPRR